MRHLNVREEIVFPVRTRLLSKVCWSPFTKQKFIKKTKSSSVYRGFGFPFLSFLYLSLSTEGSTAICDTKSKIVIIKREQIRYSLLKP